MISSQNASYPHISSHPVKEIRHCRSLEPPENDQGMYAVCRLNMGKKIRLEIFCQFHFTYGHTDHCPAAERKEGSYEYTLLTLLPFLNEKR